MDDDMMSMMGFGGFGKTKSKRTLDPKRFDKTRREEVTRSVAISFRLCCNSCSLQASARLENESKGEKSIVATPSSPEATAKEDEEEDEGDDEDDDVGPLPPPVKPSVASFEPEYDPDEEYDVDPVASGTQFPTSHELALKDHNKVISALTLDPSGARVLSGSHDYDCKLWDFGGMDHRCKPFKSWEPNGTYYVSIVSWGGCMMYLCAFRRSMTSSTQMMDKSSWSYLAHYKPKFMTVMEMKGE
jgi:WD40 repeat protein